MRSTTRATLDHYLERLDMSGDVLEVGGFTLNKCAIAAFPAPRFRYRDCDVSVGDIPDTIVADITNCRDQIPDESYDVVLSCDVFEHIDRPWQAAAEMSRILRPGGIVLTRTVWAWRNHPCPIDYWRFSPDCLEFLFEPLECLEKGYDLSERRVDYPGFWPDGGDSVPVDDFGGFRENWAVYSVHRKGPGPGVPPFKSSGHRLARQLHQDTQGRVTNPKMLGLPGPVEPTDIHERFKAIDGRLDDLVTAIEDVGRIVERLDRHRHKSLADRRRRVASAAPRAARAYRGVRRRVNAILLKTATTTDRHR